MPSTIESVDNLSFPHAAFDPILSCQDHRQGKAAELLAIQTDLTTDSEADEITEAARAGFGLPPWGVRAPCGGLTSPGC